MSAPLTMRQAAVEAGLSYERFRKVWPQLCEGEGFPAPFRARVWDPAAVAAWKAQRSSRHVLQLVAETPPKPAPADGRRAREQLQMLRAG